MDKEVENLIHNLEHWRKVRVESLEKCKDSRANVKNASVEIERLIKELHASRSSE